METQVHTLRSFVFSHSVNINAVAEAVTASQSSIDPRATIRSKVGDNGFIFIFNYGSVVFWNIPAHEQTEHLNRLLGLE